MDNKNAFFNYLIMVMSTLGPINLAQADTISAEIKSVNESKTKVLIESSRLRTVKAGDILNLGDDCALEVTQRKSVQVVLNAELCANKHLLKKGSSIELQVSKSQDVKDVASQPEGSNASLVSKDVPGAVSKGFRVEFIKSFLDGKLKASDGMSSDSASGKVNHDFGLGIGYANIGLNSPGFISRLIFTQYDNQSNSIRIDGNGTYGVTENIYFLGGFNLHKFTKGGDGLDLGFGFQVGVGFQVNQNFGLGLSYVTLNNHGKLNGIDLDFEAKGLELNLHGTF